MSDVLPQSDPERSTNRRRLWVVTELYYPEMTSTGYYLTQIAEGLAGDFDVKVICGQPNYSARGVVAPKHEVHNDVEIFRAFGTTLDKNVIIFRLINMLTISVSVFFKALMKFQKGDKVLVVTTPPSMPFITALASLVKGAEHVLLIHDNYPEILIAVGKSSENSLFVKTLNFFNRWLYKYAAKIIVVGRDMKELVTQKTAGLDIPIVTIPNWAELETVSPAARQTNSLLDELGLLDKFVFLYAGNMGHPNDLESILHCAERLKERPEVHFIFLGTGVKKGWLISKIREKRLDNITVLDPKPRTEQTVFLNACDVALVSLVTKMWGVSMPSRTYNILAAGKPILALTEKASELARVVEEDEVGWVVPPCEPGKLFDTINEIVDGRNQLAGIGARARKAALERYSLRTAVEDYRSALFGKSTK
jgi:colanic acid biosynthesis glycosyl transferase WcaI